VKARVCHDIVVKSLVAVTTQLTGSHLEDLVIIIFKYPLS
jgi:hypothetical protein